MSEPSLITFWQHQMGGQPCIRGQRITASAIWRLMTDRAMPDEQIIALYPFLSVDDLDAVRWFYSTYRIIRRRKPLVPSPERQPQ